MSFGLSQTDLNVILTEIRSNLGETQNPQIYIYGSRVKGNNREFSDIDLLLKADSYDEHASPAHIFRYQHRNQKATPEDHPFSFLS